MKKEWLKYGLLVTGFIVLVLIEYFKPRPIDWSVNFENDEPIPYGCQVLYESLPHLFPMSQISVNKINYYQFLQNENFENTTLVSVTDNFKADVYDTQTLLDFMREGNSIFICAADFSTVFLDSCNFSISTNVFDTLAIKREPVKLNFINPLLRAESGYSFPKELYRRMFTGFDTSSVTILGMNDAGKVNFIKQNIGAGNLYINLQPLTFTNYNILYGEKTYSSSALTYVNSPTIIWDEYYKPSRNLSGSPIRYILNQVSLRYAYYLVIFLIIAYILIEARRKQRVIPVMARAENTTLRFVKTIGSLYYQRGNHKDLAIKKITYINEFILSRYNLNMNEITDTKVETLMKRSGISKAKILKLISISTNIKSQKHISENRLKELNQQIEYFYNHSL